MNSMLEDEELLDKVESICASILFVAIAIELLVISISIIINELK